MSTIIEEVMEILGEMAQVLPMPFETPYAHVKRMRKIGWPSYRHAVRNMEKRGAVRVLTKNGEKFIKLTKQGQLEALFVKAKLPSVPKWDGRWRLVVFDIPEDCRDKRHVLRILLKQNNFVKLQASVFISPYALNAEALEFLKKSGLDGYIRILRVDKMDNDQKLKERFGLK